MMAQLISPLLLRGIILSVGNDTWTVCTMPWFIFVPSDWFSQISIHRTFCITLVTGKELPYLLLFFEALCLAVQPATADGVSIGAVVNLLSNDAQKYMM